MPTINNSKQGDDCSNYKGSILKESITGNKCIIGDFSRVYESKLYEQVRVDRNNFILKCVINSYSYTGQFTVIMHSTIGKFCSISWGVTIGAGEHDYHKLTTHDFLYNPIYGINEGNVAYDRFNKSVEVGNDVWIGTNATIIRGVSIGNGAVIGANSVVTKDVPPYAIVGGCPAKVIKYRFKPSVINKLQRLEWWNLPLNIIKKHYQKIAHEEIEAVIIAFESEKNK